MDHCYSRRRYYFFGCHHVCAASKREGEWFESRIILCCNLKVDTDVFIYVMRGKANWSEETTGIASYQF